MRIFSMEGWQQHILARLRIKKRFVLCPKDELYSLKYRCSFSSHDNNGDRPPLSCRFHFH